MLVTRYLIWREFHRLDLVFDFSTHEIWNTKLFTISAGELSVLIPNSCEQPRICVSVVECPIAIAPAMICHDHGFDLKGILTFETWNNGAYRFCKRVNQVATPKPFLDMADTIPHGEHHQCRLD